MDQCGRCTVKGDYEKCEETPCGKHEDWIVQHITAEFAESNRQVKHWRDQHTNEVKRARILKDRTDLPLERVRAYERMGELQGQVERQQREKEDMRQHCIHCIDEPDGALCSAVTMLETAETERDQLRAEVEDLRVLHGCYECKRLDGYDTFIAEKVEKYQAECKQMRAEMDGQEAAAKESALAAIWFGTAHTAKLPETWRAFLADITTSYEKGAESMRERAAVTAATYTWSTVALYGQKALDDLGDKIRALPLKENEG